MDIIENCYVASKTKYVELWKDLRDEGLPIISTWIDEAGQEETKCQKESFAKFSTEIQDCSLFILFAMDEDIMKGSYIELGIAMSHNKPVIIYCEDLKQKNINSLMIMGYKNIICLVEGVPSKKNIIQTYEQYLIDLI